MKNSIVLRLLTLTLASTLGCTQSSGFKSASSSSTDISHSAGCVSNKAVDVSQLKIQGASSAQPGDSVHYKLNEDVSCSSTQSVTWADASGKPVGAGTTLQQSYSKPGLYVVAAQIQTSGQLQPTEVSYKTVVTAGLALNGPQIGMSEVDNTFSLVVPSGVSVASASWNFGDGSPAQSGLGPIDYAFVNPGNYTVSVTVNLANGDQSVVTHAIQVLAAVDGMECVNQLAINGPTTATVGTPINLTVYLPSCLSWRVRSVQWDFGDSSPAGFNQTVSHTYTAAGTDHVVVSLYSGEQTTPFVTLSTDIVVSAASGGGEEGGGSTGGGTTNPNQCSMVGQTRQVNGELYSEQVACGINGTKTNTYRDVITQTCQLSGEVLTWVNTSTTKQLSNEGTCQGQACQIPASDLNGQDPASLGLITIGGNYYLPDGASKTFYSSTLPAGACSTVSTTRSCSNGVLGGSTSYNNLTCASGCEGIGPSGTTKTGVVTGTENVPRTCQFGETGIFDIYTDVSDQLCTNGTVSTSNTHRGTLQTPGVCPTYSWVGTETWSACSANCGGSQSRTYVCMSSTGAVAPDDHCSGAKPVETRVCDGNPAAAAHSESSSSTQEGGSCTMCPSNQIGVVVNERTVTITTNYACVNHQVVQVSQSESDGAWQTESYCRDYVPHRCSQDSLAISDAKGRYQWMLKCQDKVPVIKEFLQAFDKYDSGTGSNETLLYNGKTVYATFMIRNGGGTGNDTVWKAPIYASSSCTVPANIYVAAVCTASCATPDQQIMANDDDSGKLTYMKFVNAWQDQVKKVATLQANADMKSKRMAKTPVDFWVTELIDTDHDILTFNMKSGGRISLTPNHPILGADGAMKLASDWKVGDSMVKLGGDLDEVVSIVPSVYHGKVYNLFVQSSDLMRNVVVTNGYLNGTAYFQNDGANYVNKQIFRKNLIQGAFGK